MPPKLKLRLETIIMNFKKLGLIPELCKAVEQRGYDEPTPIQTQAIPAILDGRDVMGGAQTGTGKTAAFALPILQQLIEHRGGAPRALVITPTRELADQVAESYTAYGRHLRVRTLKIYGGLPMAQQIRLLEQGSDILVATPGRLMDHLGQNTVDLSQVRTLVLDEADRMLDMGFINDIKKIIRALPAHTRQTLLFSATYAKEVEKLALSILSNPVRIETAPRNAAAAEVRQVIYPVDRGRRTELLIHLIRENAWYQVLIFVRTKHGADRLAKKLHKAGIPCAAIHGDKRQGSRTRALENFKTGDLQALIATDIAARGIDLTDLGHVVNYDLPQQAEDYIHRIGRTGRAGKSGEAISLVSPEEGKKLSDIERILGSAVNRQTIRGFEPTHAAADFDQELNTRDNENSESRMSRDSDKRESRMCRDSDNPSNRKPRDKKKSENRGPRRNRSRGTQKTSDSGFQENGKNRDSAYRGSRETSDSADRSERKGHRTGHKADGQRKADNGRPGPTERNRRRRRG